LKEVKPALGSGSGRLSSRFLQGDRLIRIMRGKRFSGAAARKAGIPTAGRWLQTLWSRRFDGASAPATKVPAGKHCVVRFQVALNWLVTYDNIIQKSHDAAWKKVS
jgi:hypothetical protein